MFEVKVARTLFVRSDDLVNQENETISVDGVNGLLSS